VTTVTAVREEGADRNNKVAAGEVELGGRYDIGKWASVA